jgi:hypothetical protein
MLSGTPTTAGPYLRGFTVTDSGGNSGSVVYCGAVLPAGTRSSVDISLAVGAAGSTSTLGSSGTLQAGFAKATVNSGNAPYGTAVFSVAQNNVIVSEAGVPASPPTTSARVFIDFRSGVVNTGVALVNPGSFAANITYTLREASGQIVVTGHGSLTASTHVAKFIDQLVDIAPDFNLPADFPTTTQFGSLELSSDQPVSVVALRLTTNQRGETLLTTTPIADMTKPSSTGPTYFPQFVDGGGYTTTIVLFDDNGAPLAVRRTGGSFGSSFTYSIQPGGIFLFLTDGSAAAAHVGSVQLIPNSGNPTPAGAGVFSFSRAGVLVSESGVPSATPTTHARIFVDASNGHDTGLAISSVDGMGATVTLQAFQLDGATSTGSNRGPILLSANGHRAAFVEELISGLPSNFTGVLDISSTAPFSALTLRSLTNSRGEFLMTTFPVADFLRPAPSPVIFPQIANGGGYSTQFILLSAGGATTATLNYYDDAGNALPVGRQ